MRCAVIFIVNSLCLLITRNLNVLVKSLLDTQQTFVTVIAPARLHMGFIDLSGSLGRHFGSIGLALKEITTEITMRRADQCIARGPVSERAIRCTEKLCRILRMAVSSIVPGTGTRRLVPSARRLP